MTEFEKAMQELASLGIVSESSRKQLENAIKVNKGIEIKQDLNRKSSELELLEKYQGIKFSEEQSRILDSNDNMAIIACAGSGKTTVITNLIAKRILQGMASPNEILCIAFNTKGAEEIGARLEKVMSRTGMSGANLVEVRTFHAFFLSVLKKLGFLDKIIDNSQIQYAIIKQAAEANGLQLYENDASNLLNMISFQVNALLTNEKVFNSQANTLTSMTLQQYMLIRKMYYDEKKRQGLIDFDDMQFKLWGILVQGLKSNDATKISIAKQIISYFRGKYKLVLIDESQDMSLIQFQIMATLMSDSDGEILPDGRRKRVLKTKLIIVGDDDQCIYKFRGAEPDILLNVGATLGVDIKLLSTNYRCKENILDTARKSIEYNQARYTKEMKASNSGGNVEIIESADSLYDMSKSVLNLVKRLRETTKLKDICILTRNNAHGSIIENMLMNEGIELKISDECKFTKTMYYSDIRVVLRMATVKDFYYCDLKGILWKLIKYLKISDSNNITEVMKVNSFTLKTMVDIINDKINGKQVQEFVDTVGLDSMIQKFKPNTRTDFEELGKYLDDTYDNATRFRHIALLYKGATSGTINKSGERQRNTFGAIAYIMDLLKNYTGEQLLQYFDISEQYDSSDMSNTNGVEITTLHGAKGKEWDTVIFFGADNGTIPSKFEIKEMLIKKYPEQDIEKFIEEERRLYYVGCTRAINNLYIITNSDKSIFLEESLGTAKKNSTERYIERIKNT